MLGDRDEEELAGDLLVDLLGDLLVDLDRLRVGHRQATRLAQRLRVLGAAHPELGQDDLTERPQLALALGERRLQLVGRQVPRLHQRLADRHALLDRLAELPGRGATGGLRAGVGLRLVLLVVFALAAQCHRLSRHFS